MVASVVPESAVRGRASFDLGGHTDDDPPSPSNANISSDDESVGEHVPCWILHPNRRVKIVWDSYAISILLYTIIFAPLKIGFDIEDYCPSAIWVCGPTDDKHTQFFN